MTATATAVMTMIGISTDDTMAAVETLSCIGLVLMHVCPSVVLHAKVI